MVISDEQLAIQMQQGDEAALEAIVHRYHRQIHAYIVRMGSEYHVANDIVQEVFIKVCRHINSYKSELLFRPWIYAIASNTYKDYLKKAHVQRDLLDLETVDNIAANTALENILLDTCRREAVVAALKNLKEIYREVLILRYYQELKLEEIADTLGIPTGTIKSRLSTALHQLKKTLDREEF